MSNNPDWHLNFRRHFCLPNCRIGEEPGKKNVIHQLPRLRFTGKKNPKSKIHLLLSYLDAASKMFSSSELTTNAPLLPSHSNSFWTQNLTIKEKKENQYSSQHWCSYDTKIIYILEESRIWMAKSKKAKSPTHLSSQNLTLSPFPTTNRQQAENELIPSEITFKGLQLAWNLRTSHAKGKRKPSKCLSN